MDQKGTARPTFWIDTTNLVALVDNVYRAAANPSIGYVDADKPMNTLIARLTSKHAVKQDDLESSLWSCNMMSELNKFWHPNGLSFEQFVSDLKLNDHDFDRLYNMLNRKETKQ